MEIIFNPYKGEAEQYYSVREVLERLFTPLPENKLNKFGKFISNLFRHIYKQKPLKDKERVSYFVDENVYKKTLVNVYPKTWLWEVVVSSIKLYPDFFYEE